MGQIKDEVYDLHLSQFPDEEALLKPFLAGFDITWGRRRRAYNTDVSVYFLKPLDHIREAFGFEQELMMVYSPYPTLEPRSVQAAEKILHEDPARGRVERLTYLLVSDMPDPAQWVQDYVSANQETRLIAAFPTAELRVRGGDAWYVRNQMDRQFYGRDLFNFRLPLRDDTYFFGRDAEVLSYRDSIRRGENRGLFGLRKTGKTSLLFKVERVVQAEGLTTFLYIDCQTPQIRSLRWHELLADLTARFRDSDPPTGTPAQIARQFTEAVHRATTSQRAVMVFDEIEYISPLSKQNLHWQSDFVDFWQTVRACQTRYRRAPALLVLNSL